MSLPRSMRMAPSLTATSPSPPKLADFQPVSALPSKRTFHFTWSLPASPWGGAALPTGHVPRQRQPQIIPSMSRSDFDMRSVSMAGVWSPHGVSVPRRADQINDPPGTLFIGFLVRENRQAGLDV